MKYIIFLTLFLIGCKDYSTCTLVRKTSMLSCLQTMIKLSEKNVQFNMTKDELVKMCDDIAVKNEVDVCEL